MNRLTKWAREKGIIFNAPDVILRPEEDCDRHIVTITEKFIVTVYYSAVLPPEFHIFDRNGNLICCQDVYKEHLLFDKGNPWEVGFYE